MFPFEPYTASASGVVIGALLGAVSGIVAHYLAVRRLKISYACLGAASFAMLATAWRGSVAELAAVWALSGVLLYVTCTDIDRRMIPDAAIALAVVVRACCITATCYWQGFPVLPALGGMLASGAAAAVPLALLASALARITGQDALGGGDVKLVFATACYLGLQKALTAMAIACVGGLVTAAIMRKRAFPFAPAISFATWLSFIAMRG